MIQSLPSIFIGLISCVLDSSYFMLLSSFGSVLCLLAYWVANFLVPAMIFKNVQTNRESNEEDDDDESSDEDE